MAVGCQLLAVCFWLLADRRYGYILEVAMQCFVHAKDAKGLAKSAKGGGQFAVFSLQSSVGSSQLVVFSQQSLVRSFFVDYMLFMALFR